MTDGLTSIVIPTYNHATWLPEAIESALAQTAPVDVIVIDDGSTDTTSEVLERYAGRIRVIRVPHGGPCAARNAGIEAADGEFVMFLDADDLIAPTKVARQLDEFAAAPHVGWVLCDVRIENEATRTGTSASKQYRYDEKPLDGWIDQILRQGNFIPIMSPLVRRAVLSDRIRFDERLVPEDHHFWCAVASQARVRYVPEVLATYRHRRTGRSRLPKKARPYSRHPQDPLRLNLGCGTPGTRSWHPIDGLVNLDKSLGWVFEEGLGDFVDHSVAGITISHALMYVRDERWPFVFSEFSRVLMEGGVVRITEDDAIHPQSARRGGWKGSDPAVTLINGEKVMGALRRAGLVPYAVSADTTHYRDRSLCQAQHGSAPDVCFVEGVKLPGTVFAPHNDDETLFAAFTVLRYRPRVVICFGSAGDYGDSATREQETRDAMAILGASTVEQWQGGDLEAQMRAFDARVHPIRAWAPHIDTSHPDHRSVAIAAAAVFGDRLTSYHTYRDGAKVRRGTVVDFEPEWVEQKLRALTRYTTQLRHPRAHRFFTFDLLEYQGA